MYDMINIFEVFLPQLLRYPNPSDPLNGEAAALMMREPKAYEAKVKGTLHFFRRISDPVLSSHVACRMSILITRIFHRIPHAVRPKLCLVSILSWI